MLAIDQLYTATVQIPSFLELERLEWCINCIIMENTMPKKPKKVKSIRYFHVKKGYELFQNFGLGIYFCHSNFGNSTAKLTWGWGRLCEGLLITSSKSSSKSSASSNSLLRSVKRPSLPWPRGTVPPNTLVSWKKKRKSNQRLSHSKFGQNWNSFISIFYFKLMCTKTATMHQS